MRNAERIALTRGRLLAAGRALFAARGFAATSTDEILAEAGVTRGALYHHFRDKAELFEAICRDLSAAAMSAIEAAVDGIADPVAALEVGSLAWMDYMLHPEVRRLLVVEAPAVLGWQRWQDLDEAHSFRLLAEGVADALAAGALCPEGTAESIATVLNGAMNAVVLRLGSDPAQLAAGRQTVIALIRALAR